MQAKSKTPEARRAYRAANREHILDRERAWSKSNPEKVLSARTRYRLKNREKIRGWDRRWKNCDEWRKHERERDAIPSVRIQHLVRRAKRRADRRGICFDKNAFSEFLIAPPIECECCGVGLDYSTWRMNFSQQQSRSPSFDRIDNAIGYEVGNVAALCTRCNAIKSDASAAELRLLADYAAGKSLRGAAPAVGGRRRSEKYTKTPHGLVTLASGESSV